mgnify:CR=1 FL=1
MMSMVFHIARGNGKREHMGGPGMQTLAGGDNTRVLPLYFLSILFRVPVTTTSFYKYI